MAKFVIAPHMRLHEWVAEEKGYFTDAGLDHEFRDELRSPAGRLHDLGIVIVEAAHIVLNSHTYLIAGVAPWAAYETVRHEFFATINSFGGQPAVDGACIVTAPSSRPAAVFDFSPASAAGSLT